MNRRKTIWDKYIDLARAKPFEFFTVIICSIGIVFAGVLAILSSIYFGG